VSTVVACFAICALAGSSDARLAAGRLRALGTRVAAVSAPAPATRQVQGQESLPTAADAVAPPDAGAARESRRSELVAAVVLGLALAALIVTVAVVTSPAYSATAFPEASPKRHS